MSAQEPYGQHGSASDYPTDPAVASPRARKPRRSRGRRALAALVILLIVALVAGVFLYNFLTAYFAMNGSWYGPMKLQTGPTTVTLQVYMDLSTYINGDLSGTGAICSKTPIIGNISTVNLGVNGKHDGQTVRVSLAASTNTVGLPPFIGVAIGPGLELHGDSTSLKKSSIGGLLVDGTADSLKLSGDAGAAPVSVTMKRGSAKDFSKACDAQPAVG